MKYFINFKWQLCITRRVALFFLHLNASPIGHARRSKVKKTVPAPGTLANIKKKSP